LIYKRGVRGRGERGVGRGEWGEGGREGDERGG